MALSEADIKSVGNALHHARRILLVSHIRPDGDSIGSLLGLGLALQAGGKKVWMVSPDGVPANLRHLPGANLVRQRAEGGCDLVGVVDCSDLKRTGEALQRYPLQPGQLPHFNIDHHITNLNFARFNLVDPTAVSTSEIITDLLPKVGVEIPQDAAAALLTGLITDSLGFRTSNMRPNALRVAARLMEAGVDLPELYRRSLITRSFEATQMWARGLGRMERAGRLVWTTLTQGDRQELGYPGRDDADLINVLASIDEVDICVIFVEQANERVKVSWRSQPGFDVSKVAVTFGGGGHPAASGAEIPGSLEEVQALVLEATQPLLQVRAENRS